MININLNKNYCKCGCNKEIYFGKNYVVGHNWKNIDGNRGSWNKGKKTGQVPWNKGITKGMDIRIQNMAIKSSNNLKGKSYEEIYGKERAEEIKRKMKGRYSSKKGKTFEELYGKERAEEMKLNMSITYKGRKAWNKGFCHFSDEQRKQISIRMKGKSTWNKGLKNPYSENVVKNISNTLKEHFKNNPVNNKIKNKISIGVRKAVDKMYTQERNKKISTSLTGKKQSIETIKKISVTKKNWSLEQKNKFSKKLSDTRIKCILKNNGVNPGGYKKVKRGSFYSQKNQKEIKYDSSYELQAYQILEQLSKVKFYDRCKFSIDYTFKDNFHRYIPDIEVTYDDNTKEIIEVKPIYLLNEEQNIAKFKAAKEYCNKNNIRFSVWTEKRIKMFKQMEV